MTPNKHIDTAIKSLELSEGDSRFDGYAEHMRETAKIEASIAIAVEQQRANELQEEQIKLLERITAALEHLILSTFKE